MQDTLVTPVIVVGSNRSGTRWLTTLICRHPEIAGIRDTYRKDIGDLALETNMFSIFPRMYGDISRANKYIAMIEQWSTTLFFRLLGIDKSELYLLDPRPSNCVLLFRAAMDIYTRKQGKAFWVQKTTPRGFRNIADYMPEASYITIQRDVMTNIRSKLKKLGSGETGFKARDVAKMVFLYVSDERIIRRISRDRRVRSLVIRYEDLVDDKNRELKRICNFLGLPFSETMLSESLYRNTRFTDVDQKEKFFSSGMVFRIRLYRFLFRLVPGRLLWFLRDHFGGAGDSDFINSTFRHIKEEYRID